MTCGTCKDRGFVVRPYTDFNNLSAELFERVDCPECSRRDCDECQGRGYVKATYTQGVRACTTCALAEIKEIQRNEVYL